MASLFVAFREGARMYGYGSPFDSYRIKCSVFLRITADPKSKELLRPNTEKREVNSVGSIIKPWQDKRDSTSRYDIRKIRVPDDYVLRCFL